MKNRNQIKAMQGPEQRRAADEWMQHFMSLLVSTRASDRAPDWWTQAMVNAYVRLRSDRFWAAAMQRWKLAAGQASPVRPCELSSRGGR